MPKGREAFWDTFAEATWDVFLHVNDGDIESARSSAIVFAKTAIPEDEHDELENLPLPRLKRVVAGIFAERPESLDAHWSVDTQLHKIKKRK